MKKKLILLYLFSITAWSQNKAVVDSITYYQNKEEIIKALSYADKKAKLYLKQKNYEQYCEVASRKANLYTKLKDYTKGLQVLFDAYKIIEKKPLPLEKVFLNKKIGDYYYLSEKRVESVAYYEKALQIAKPIYNDTLTAGIYYGLCRFHLEIQDFEMAYPNAKKMLPLYKAKGTYTQKANAYKTMAGCYALSQKYDVFKKYLDSSSVYANLSKNKKTIIGVLGAQAYYYTVVEKNQKKAEIAYLEQLKSYGNDTLNDNVTTVYENLSYVYEQMKDYKSANLYLNKYRINSIAVSNSEINSQINQVETRYKVQKKADEFEAKEQRLKDAQKKRQLFYIIVIVGLIMLLLLIAVLFQFHKLKQKNKLNSIESNLKENLINATIDGQETERKNVATVLHDNVSALLSSAGLQLMAFSASHTAKSEEITKASAIIKEAHDKVRDLSHQLVPTLLAKFGLIYALEDLCEKNSNSKITFDFTTNLNTKTRFEEDYEMKLYFIISEIINNVLKHSNASQATVIITKENENLVITVNDNGQGFEVSKDKSNEGFGITQIRARINNLKGKLDITSAKGKGTTVAIQVPILEKPSTAIA